MLRLCTKWARKRQSTLLSELVQKRSAAVTCRRPLNIVNLANPRDITGYNGGVDKQMSEYWANFGLNYNPKRINVIIVQKRINQRVFFQEKRGLLIMKTFAPQLHMSYEEKKW